MRVRFQGWSVELILEENQNVEPERPISYQLSAISYQRHLLGSAD